MSEQPQQQEAACESETAEEAPAAETKTVESEARAETAETALSSTAADEPQPEAARNERGQIRHQHPKLGFNQLAGETLAELRKIAKDTGVSSITTRRKDDLINDILKTQAEALGYRYNGGTLECMPEGYGFLRPSGLLPSSNDIYVSASQIRRFGLRNGDVVWGIIRPPKDQEHYEALLRVENVNFTDPEEARRRPHFEALTPIFPDEKLQLETDRRQIATRIVDIFAPIGKGQRALIVSPPKAGKTTLLKSLAHSITTNHPEVILMVLLIDERPEEVTDMARSVDGEIIASTFDRPAEEHLRVAGLALEKAKRLVEVSKDVVLLLDSITRLARASNLVVPPSGRTLSGGMDPAALYFPKKFFGAARNIENGGSLTIIGTSLVETGSRMDDVIYEEFKGTGNMEVHLSRKIAEQRIFPALDITKSGTRKEELMVPEADLQRIWSLRRKIANMDEAEVLNLILDKLRNTPTNRDFLATIKVG
ncbi:transcription termination factor Rho [Cloacibacillus sp. An23]|uniref:transcription termination factor Rho n=1 Tax=Cloacibacillus sp. An23 TaxID=1965591 RepID=UPI001EF5839C|nr:transcription termination factor Rho [Cloacibacillus sp. An23]